MPTLRGDGRPRRCARCLGDVTDANRVSQPSESGNVTFVFDSTDCRDAFLREIKPS